MDHQIRLKGFEWLDMWTATNGEVFTRDALKQGFEFKGEKITLVGPRGIWKPKSMLLPISVTAIEGGPYEDTVLPGNFIQYKYEGTDPFHFSNRGLRQLLNKRIPLIFFYSFEPGFYLASWPAFIQNENVQNLSFEIALDDQQFIERESTLESPDAEFGRRTYITSSMKVRLHQRSFRERVIKAYNIQCSLCRLKHKELLDAAHIIPDSEKDGLPIVQNGLSLCKIHHAAFDKNILGISPNYKILVRRDILEEIDGPMLKYGIQQLDRQKIILPSKRKLWPDRDRLDVRYREFLEAS